MSGNPLIDQGTLVRVIAGIQFTNFPQLNISASYLGKEGIRLNLGGKVTTFIDTLTGRVTSPEPYQPITVVVNLLKTQSLGAAFKTQLETLSLLGDFVVYPDVTSGLGITPYPVFNGAIEEATPNTFDGQDPLWVLTLGGSYNINAGLWP